MDTISGNDLWKRIRDNDRELIGELRSIVERLVRKWQWGDPDIADDLAQDCFVKILENLRQGQFRAESSLKTYVYTIVRRTCIDHYRARRAVEATDIEKVVLIDERPSAEQTLLDREARSTAARVLLALPAECRRLWRLVFYRGKNYRQAGEALGLAEGTIKRKMWECRRLAMNELTKLDK
jgi:RNA polymerase sigma-70 factor (ECF subfamily)